MNTAYKGQTMDLTAYNGSNRRRTHTQGLWATEDLQAAKQQNVDTHTVPRDPQTDQQLMLLTKHSMSQHASILFEKTGLKCIDFSDLIY